MTIAKRTPAERTAYQQLLRERIALVQSHADADYTTKRGAWVCACGLCREYRESGFKPAQERKPLSIPF